MDSDAALIRARRVFEQHRDGARKAALVRALTRVQTQHPEGELSAISVERLDALAALFAQDSHTLPEQRTQHISSAVPNRAKTA